MNSLLNNKIQVHFEGTKEKEREKAYLCLQLHYGEI